MPREFNKITHRKKRAFLAAYAVTGNITDAAGKADIDRGSHYHWLETDDQYAAAFDAAKLMACEALESEARRRAVQGVRREKPIYHNGHLLTTVVETDYSDTLLIFLLKGAMPDKYKDRVDVRVSVRQEAERLANELGLDVDDVLAEAGAILAGSK